MCQNICVFLSKVARATVSRARERPDPHQVRSLCTKVGGRPGRRTFRNTHGYPYLAARTPQCTTVWGISKSGIFWGRRIYQQKSHCVLLRMMTVSPNWALGFIMFGVHPQDHLWHYSLFRGLSSCHRMKFARLHLPAMMARPRARLSFGGALQVKIC